MSNLSTLPKGDSAWLLRKAIERIIQQVSVLETNIGSSTTGNSANTQIIFNDNGTLRGDAGLTYNKTTDLLTVGAATITGDLTVDTNVLKVDTTNNRVGIGTASPTVPLYVTGNNATATAIIQDETNGAKLRLLANSINFDLSNGGGGGGISVSGNNPIIFQTNGSEQMRLNSTGLGVGVASPNQPIQLSKSNTSTALTAPPTGGASLRIQNTSSTNNNFGSVEFYNAAGLFGASINCQYTNQATPTNDLVFVVRGSGGGIEAARIDSSGNVGIAVTPSAKLHVEGGGAQARFSIASASDARHEYYRNGIREGLITWDANVIGLYATQSSGEVVIASSNTIRVRVKAGGQVRFVPLASDPAGAEAGDVYYNSTSNKLKCYNGTTWNDLF